MIRANKKGSSSGVSLVGLKVNTLRIDMYNGQVRATSEVPTVGVNTITFKCTVGGTSGMSFSVTDENNNVIDTFTESGTTFLRDVTVTGTTTVKFTPTTDFQIEAEVVYKD